MRDFFEAVFGVLSIIGTLVLIGALWVGSAYVIGLFFGLVSRGYHLVA